MGLRVCEFPNRRLIIIPRDTELPSFSGFWGLLVYSILSHGRVTHRPGLFIRLELVLNLLIFSIKVK
jgi:hypothetical protein